MPPTPVQSTEPVAFNATPQARLLTARILAGNAPVAQLWFDAAVLDKYHQGGATVLRTNTIGRLKLAAWSVDFGIADGEGIERALIHLSVADAQARIPEAERAHWSAHAVLLPVSPNFVTLQISRGACVDDGDLRPWTPESGG